jgi:hypothetical protein
VFEEYVRNCERKRSTGFMMVINLNPRDRTGAALRERRQRVAKRT